MTRKSKEMRTWLRWIPEIDGSEYWEEIEGYSACHAAQRAVSEAIPDYSELEMYGLGSEPTIRVHIKKSERAKKIEIFEVMAEVEVHWEAWPMKD